MSAWVTGVGSLFLEEGEEAVAFVAEVCPKLPFWPQLPKLPGQRMDTEGVGAPGFVAFDLAVAGGAFPEAEGLKGQLAGPITLAACATNGETPGELSVRVARAAAAQVDRLKRHGLPVQIWIDEPCLGDIPEADVEGVLAPVVAAIREAGALAGLHCCATTGLPLNAVSALAPDVFSFDAWTQLESFCAHLAAPQIVGKSRVAWGLIPTLEALPRVDVLAARWLEATAALGEPGELAARSLFTASCGLANHTAADARASFALARELAERLDR